MIIKSANFLLLLTSIIWGFAFVAQRAGMDHVGPFFFNGIRFLLGGLILLPVIFFFTKSKDKHSDKSELGNSWYIKYGGYLLGTILFIAASMQQVGIVSTSAGNAGFITGLYVVVVPLLSVILRKKVAKTIWLSAALSVAGLYILSVKDNFNISAGDIIITVSTVVWAVHVLYIGLLSSHRNSLIIAMQQFLVCGLLSIVVSFFVEENNVSGIYNSLLPILYGGVLSVGVAYTLQVVAQKKANPSHAAVILSMESLFAVLGGCVILNEPFTVKIFIGCLLMFCGMMLAQIDLFFETRKHKS